MAEKAAAGQRRVLPPFPMIELSIAGDSVTAVFFAALGHSVGVPALVSAGEGGVGAAGGKAAALLASANGMRFCRVHATDASGQVEELAVNVKTAKLVPVAADGTINVGPLPSASGRPGGSAALRGRKGIGFAAIGVLVAVLGAGGWIVGGELMGGNGPEGPTGTAIPAPTNAPAQLPVLPPPGFDTYAQWSSALAGTGLGAGTPVIRVDGDTIWSASGSTISRYDATTGVLLGRADAGFKVSALVQTNLGMGTGIAAYDGRRRVKAFNEDGTPGTDVDFGEKVSSVSFGGDRPLASSETSSTPATVRVWTVGDSGSVQERLVPAGAVALASMGGTVFAVNVEESKAWWISTGEARFPEPVKIIPPTPAGTLKTSNADAGAVIDGYWVVKIPVTASGKASVGLRTAAVKVNHGRLGAWLEPNASATVPSQLASAAGAGAPGVNGSMLCAGAGAWDLTSGKAVPVPAGSSWNAAGCAGGQLWLRKADQMIRLDGQGTTIASVSSQAYTNTSVLGISSTGLAIVVAATADGEALYGLEPATGEAK